MIVYIIEAYVRTYVHLFNFIIIILLISFAN